jgi:hypothetical protein
LLDANPSSSTKENDYHSSKTLMSKTLEKRKTRAKSTDYVYEDDNPAGRKTARQKLVMDMAVIGAENRLVSEETADDGEPGIQKWN